MDHLIDDEELPRRERELTLSTASILGIFLGLVVLCGAFFGFGYNMGRKSAPTPLSLSDVAPEPAVVPSSAPTLGKPAAGSPVEAAVPVPTPKPARHVSVTPPPSTHASTATAETTPKPAAPKATAAITPAPIVRQPTPVSPSALSPTVPAAGATGTYMVQVAAVSHQDDATLLVGALRARGYAVSAHSTGTDNFIHVQVGPFHDKKEADAMRQRLLTDGYNAIVKQ